MFPGLFFSQFRSEIKNKMKAALHAFVFILLLFSLVGCGEGVERPEDIRETKTGYGGSAEQEEAVIEIMGTIVYKEFEGGFYAIEGNDGEQYDPANLPEAFQQEGLSVVVTARKKTDLMTTRMFGTVIEILEIQKR